MDGTVRLRRKSKLCDFIPCWKLNKKYEKINDCLNQQCICEKKETPTEMCQKCSS